jgi:hypothetical protein
MRCPGGFGPMCGDAGKGARGANPEISWSPRDFIGGLHFAQVSAGGWTARGVARSGGTYCRGRNSYGVVGDGTVVDRYEPTLIAGGS